MNKHFIVPVLLSIYAITQISCSEKAVIRPVSLTCENMKEPCAVDIPTPRLSWINTCESGIRSAAQTAYEINVASSRKMLMNGEADLWKSGKTESSQSYNIRYGGNELKTGQDCWWQVRVWDNKGNCSAWSNPSYWGMGIMNESEWQAKWIGAPWQGEEPLPTPPYPKGVNQSVSPFKTPTGNIPPNAPLLRKSFTISKKIIRSKAFISGLGFFELQINGKKVSDDVLVPNTTLYGKREDIGSIGVMTGNNFSEYRVMYLVYDITELLSKGENVAGIILGNGFYNPASFWTTGYGTPRVICQIRNEYSDGTEEIIASDTDWKAARSPILMDLVYDGEHYDARLEQSGWSSPGFNDSSWENAVFRTKPDGKMMAHMAPVDKVMETLKPQRIEKISDGHFTVDFGEEISGWIRIKNVTGEAGRRIEIRYKCESPQGENSYTMKGGTPETYAARFTWFVFREAEIVNWPGELKADQIQAEAVYSDVETTGKFESSDSLYNKINKIWWRSQTDNMHGGIASDCPHRERAPYTGDGQVACVTVMHNFDAKSFYTKWIRDIMGSQNPDNGYVPNGAPWQKGCGGGVAWGAAMNIMPWKYYLHYGDNDLLAENYEGMKGYIRYMLTWSDGKGIMFSQAPEKSKPNRWINLGEWVAPYELPPDPMVHTFYLWRCADLTARAAKALGKTDDENYFSSIAGKTRKAFQDAFYDSESGTYGPYGGNVFALKMGVPEEQRSRVIEALKNDIRMNGYHLDTGIFGTQFLFEVLADNGLQELAAKIMSQKSYPGFGWWIAQGATTTWEKWDGGGSRNHPMFGGGLTWFYRKLSGMNTDPEEPGYKHIVFRPQPVKGISWASYYNITPYGEAGIKWERQPGKYLVNIKVPPGSHATVYVPADQPDKIYESGLPAAKSECVEFIEMKDEYAVYRVKSGEYSFTSELNDIIITERLNEYFKKGEFSKIKILADSISKSNTLNIALKETADSLAMTCERIRYDFILAEQEVNQQLADKKIKYTPDERNLWEKTGWLESRITDGNRMYFKRTVSNLGLMQSFQQNRGKNPVQNSTDPVELFKLRNASAIMESSDGNGQTAVPVKIKASYTLSVTADAVPEGEIIRCWLPFPGKGHLRQNEIRLLSSSQEKYTIAPDSAIHSTIYMEKKARKGVPTVFNISYQYTSSGQYFDPDKIKILAYKKETYSYKKFTSEQLPHIRFSDEIRRTADSLTAGITDPIKTVEKIYIWFKDNIPWAGALEYSTINDIPGYVMRYKRGDCGMQTFLLISMLRYKGIPVRWQSGWMVPQGGLNLHDWCEVYYEGTGWVPVDVSYDRLPSENRKVSYFYMNGIDSYRLIINDGTGGDLFPPKEFSRSEPNDFQRGEVEWKGGNLYFDKWDYNMKIEYIK